MPHDSRSRGRLTVAGMIHTLEQLRREASELGLVATDVALSEALRLCAQETSINAVAPERPELLPSPTMH